MDLQPHHWFALILLAVPVQYYLSPESTSHIKYRLQRLIDSVYEMTEAAGVELPFSSLRGADIPLDDTMSAEQLMKLSYEERKKLEQSKRAKAEDKYYGLSTEVRERAPHVQFRVGDVVMHKINKYRGVVIGWDLEAKASKEFLAKVHKGNKKWIHMPNYAILIDTRDRLIPQLGYVVQENLKIYDEGRVLHPMTSQFFERYDERKRKFIPRPILKRIYPDD